MLARTSQPGRAAIARWALLAVAVLMLVVLLGEFWPLGPDYYYTMRPVAEAFYQGETRVYDQTERGFYDAPWTVFLLAPTLLFPPSYGQAILTMISLSGVLFAVYAVNGEQRTRMGLLGIVLAAANLHTFDLVERGNLEGFLLYGLGLAWLGARRDRPLLCGLGLLLMSIKPVNVLLPAVVMLWEARDWPAKHKLLAVAPVGAAFVISFPLCGWDWPVRYVQAMTTSAPYVFLQTSLWRMSEWAGLGRQWAYWLAVPVYAAVVWFTLRRGTGPGTLALALAANLTFTPYALGSHYVLLAPVLVMLASFRRWMLALWLLTLTPLLRLSWGFGVAWIDAIYPAALLVGVLYLLRQEVIEREARVSAGPGYGH